MVDHHHWQLDGSAPELYEKYLVPAITTKWAEDIVGRAQPQAGKSSRRRLRNRSCCPFGKQADGSRARHRLGPE